MDKELWLRMGTGTSIQAKKSFGLLIHIEAGKTYRLMKPYNGSCRIRVEVPTETMETCFELAGPRYETQPAEPETRAKLVPEPDFVQDVGAEVERRMNGLKIR